MAPTRKKIKFIVLLTEYCFGRPPQRVSHYVTAKYSLMGLSKTMAIELARYGSTVNMISPGMTNTDLLNNLPSKLIEIEEKKNPLKRIAEPEDIANAVLFLASEESNYYNGTNLLINGGNVIF